MVDGFTLDLPFNARQLPMTRLTANLKTKRVRKCRAFWPGRLRACLLWRKEGLKKPASVLDASKEYKGEMDVFLVQPLRTPREDGRRYENGLGPGKRFEKFNLSGQKIS